MKIRDCSHDIQHDEDYKLVFDCMDILPTEGTFHDDFEFRVSYRGYFTEDLSNYVINVCITLL